MTPVQQSMRSLRGLFAATAFLLIVPLAALGSALFNIDAEITVHFVAAVGFMLLALSVFDFLTPRWLTWAACAAASISAFTYALQGVSNLTPNNEALHYVAFQLLGQQLERVLPDVLIVWFVGLLVTDSRGKTRMLGFAVMLPVVAIEVLGYAFSIYEVAPVLRLALLLPFVWLPFESARKATRERRAAAFMRPSIASA